MSEDNKLKILNVLTESVRNLALSTECFGLYTDPDDNSECPEYDCDIRKPCQQLCNLNNLNKSSLEKVKDNNYVEAASELVEAPPDPREYIVDGYVNYGRNTDLASEKFTAVFANFNVTITATASYHTVSWRDAKIARIWHDTVPDTIKVDLTPEVAVVVEKSKFSEVVSIPEGSIYKSKPLIKRAVFTDIEKAPLLAKLICKYYSIELKEE